MAFSLTKFIKGLRVSKENSINPQNIDIIPSGTAGTTTTLTSTQTVNRTILLPNVDGTLLTTDSIIGIDQLETLTPSRAMQTDLTGKISVSSVTITELGYVSGVTTSIQTQFASRASTTLGNILPIADVNMNGQKVINSATPTNPADLATKAYVDAQASAGGASTTLSNLVSPTAINQDLIFATVTGNIKTPNVAGVSAQMNIKSGDSSGNNTGGIVIASGAASNQSGDITLTTGTSVAQPSGNINLIVGTSSGSTRGEISLNGLRINVNSTKIINVIDPTSAQEAATKNYVDNNGGGSKVLIVKLSTTTGSITATESVVTYDNVVRNDMVGSYNTSTYIFTVPTTGKYCISAQLTGVGTLSSTIATNLIIKDIGLANYIGAGSMYGNGNNIGHIMELVRTLILTAGTRITMVTNCGAGSLSYTYSAPVNQQLVITYLGA